MNEHGGWTDLCTTFLTSLEPYLDKSSVMFSSLIPPNTLNFFRLQTWVFSYFPKVMLWTTAGLSNFKIKNWYKRAELMCDHFVEDIGSSRSLKVSLRLVPLLKQGHNFHNLLSSPHQSVFVLHVHRTHLWGIVALRRPPGRLIIRLVHQYISTTKHKWRKE